MGLFSSVQFENYMISTLYFGINSLLLEYPGNLSVIKTENVVEEERTAFLDVSWTDKDRDTGPPVTQSVGLGAGLVHTGLRCFLRADLSSGRPLTGPLASQETDWEESVLPIVTSERWDLYTK